MKKVKCIIVDDESLARDLLQEYLSEYEEIDVVAHCSGGREAIKKIDELQAELVFLDVQMPRMDGFDVLEKIKTNPL
jgi:two-component system LytT family response regulator